MSFGTQLRFEREERGVGLAEIAAGTKLSERYLRALEGDEFAELPGGIFNKGLVRGYCRHLGLEEEAWLEKFTAAAAPVEPAEPDWGTFAENVKRTRANTGASRQKWWGVVLMMVVLAALAWAVWHFVVKPRMMTPKTETPAVGAVQTSTPEH